MKRIVIADLGTGNLRSVFKAIEHVSEESTVTISSEPDLIESSDHLVLPGQGALGTWIQQLDSDLVLKQAIHSRIKHGPVLGICLGLQALYEFSEENQGTRGLGILSGRVRHFSGHGNHSKNATQTGKLKIPHMGWNNVIQTAEHPLWQGIENNERFYFVHSYYVESDVPEQVLGECQYGNQFTAAAGLENLFATQFHPEKSQKAGLKLLENFVNWNGVL